MPATDAPLTPEQQNIRKIIAHAMVMQSMQSQPPPYIEITPHSPTSSFDFAAGGLFDPAGSGPTMQGGSPVATGRDFSGVPAGDWGGAQDYGDPNPSPTMSAPDMHASPHATPTFDTGREGMPSAPGMFDFAPAPGQQDTSITSPGGFGQGFAAGADMMGGGIGGIGGMGGVGEGAGGLGAVGGTEGVGGMGDPGAGSVG